MVMYNMDGFYYTKSDLLEINSTLVCSRSCHACVCLLCVCEFCLSRRRLGVEGLPGCHELAREMAGRAGSSRLHGVRPQLINSLCTSPF
jgi:hypothetical protein